MDIGSIPLFALADQRLAWVDKRQSLLAQNISNVDTPAFAGRDMLPFEQALAQTGFEVTMTQTSPADLPGTAAPLDPTSVALSGDLAPDGNNVSLDDQLVRLADTDSTHELVTNLYSKYLGLFRTALDR
jgi:flagellar basal-body rod protein FlgB